MDAASKPNWSTWKYWRPVDTETKEQIFVLPEDMRLEEVIDAYVIKTNYFVEYLNCNSRGVLDGFLDHNNNMYVRNDEYETRKLICETLYSKYKIDDLVRTKSVLYFTSHVTIQTNVWVSARIAVQ